MEPSIYAQIAHMRAELTVRGGGLLEATEMLGSKIIKLKTLANHKIMLHGQSSISKTTLKNHLYRLEGTGTK